MKENLSSFNNLTFHRLAADVICGIMRARMLLKEQSSLSAHGEIGGVKYGSPRPVRQRAGERRPGYSRVCLYGVQTPTGSSCSGNFLDIPSPDLWDAGETQQCTW